MSKFTQLEGKLAAKSGKTPEEEAGLAAYIGRKKLGKGKFQAKATAGRRKHRGH